MDKPLPESRFHDNESLCIRKWGLSTEQDEQLVNLYKRGIFSFEANPLNYVIFEDSDKFCDEKHISILKSRRFKDFGYSHPFNIVFISKPKGERFYIVADNHIDSMIININNEVNVKLSINDTDVDFLERDAHEKYERIVADYYGPSSGRFEVIKHLKPERTYLSISKEDFLRCCQAEHLSVRIISNSYVTYEKDDSNDLISFFQMLYTYLNKDNLFIEKKDIWKHCLRNGNSLTIKAINSLNPKVRMEVGNQTNLTNKQGCSGSTVLIVCGGLILLAIIIIALS